MKLTLLLIPVFLLSGCGHGEDTSYYKELLENCYTLEKHEQGGCFQSVNWMEKNGFLEAINGQCPSEMTINMNKTMGSKRWCEPINPSTEGYRNSVNYHTGLSPDPSNPFACPPGTYGDGLDRCIIKK